eukprot:6214500-Pleurochrysis_carterae.AAC.2
MHASVQLALGNGCMQHCMEWSDVRILRMRLFIDFAELHSPACAPACAHAWPWQQRCARERACVRARMRT